MKTPYLNRETALKATLMLVIGVNFVANLPMRDLGTRFGSASLSTETPAGEVVAVTDSERATGDANLPRLSLAGQGATRTRGVTPTTNTALAAEEQTTQVRWLDQRPAAIEVTTCREPDRRYLVSFHPAQTQEGFRTTVEVREAARAQERAVLFSLPMQPGNANESAVREELYSRVQRQLRAQDRECTARAEPRESEGYVCEGDNMTEIAAFSCNLGRLRGIRNRQPRLAGAEMMAAIEALTESLKGALRSIAAGDCDRETGPRESACRRGNVDALKRDVANALRGLMSNRDVNRERIRRLIAGLDGVIAAERAAQVARRGREEGERLREQMREAQNELRDAMRACLADAREAGGMARAVIQNCREEAAELNDRIRELRAERVDKFRDAWQGGPNGEYQRLADLRESMDRTEWNELRNYARPEFLSTLRTLRQADANPIDFLTGLPDRTAVAVNAQMDGALRRIGVRSGDTATPGFTPIETANRAGGTFTPVARGPIGAVGAQGFQRQAFVNPANNFATVPFGGGNTGFVPVNNNLLLAQPRLTPFGNQVGVPVRGAGGAFTPINDFSGATFSPGSPALLF